MAKKKKLEVVLKNGAVFPVMGETSRYYLCDVTQFRKENPDIAEVREIANKVAKTADEFPVSVSTLGVGLAAALEAVEHEV